MSEARHPQPSEQFPVSWAIFALARTHRNAAAAELAPLGLTPGQELLLFQLWAEDGVPQKQLIEALGLDHSTVAKSIKRLENAGIVRREQSAQDGRVTLVRLTTTGRELEERVRAAWRDLESRTTAGLSPEQQREFAELARSVLGGL